MSCLRFAGILIFFILLFSGFIFSSPACSQVTNFPAKKQILFICTGNFFRSRFAEAFFNKLAEENHLGWHAVSRGLNLDASQHGISGYTQQELTKRGVPQELYNREPMALAKKDLQTSDYIVLMDEAEHRPMFEKQFEAREDKKLHYWHIPETDEAEIPKTCENMSLNVRDLIHQFGK